MPCACWTMPTSSTSVSRWSLRRLVRWRSATPAGRRRGASSERLAQDGGGRLGDGRPGERGPDPARLGPRRERATPAPRGTSRPRRRAPPDRRTGRAGPRRRRACPARTSTASRRSPQPAASREGQRAGGDLLAVAVRRHEHVGRGEQVGELVDREEAVVELDVVAEPELDHAPLEHQRGSARPRDARRRDACGPAITYDDAPAAARASPAAPRSPSRAPSPARSARTSRAGSVRRRVGRPAAKSRTARVVSRLGAPCGTTRTFSAGQAPHSTSSRSAVSVITITSSASRAELREHLGLVRRRLGEHRVQRHDQRLRELLREREHVLAVARRRRSRTRAGGGRRRRRAGRASARCGRSRRGRPARSSRAGRAAAGSTAR